MNMASLSWGSMSAASSAYGGGFSTSHGLVSHHGKHGSWFQHASRITRVHILSPANACRVLIVAHSCAKECLEGATLELVMDEKPFKITQQKLSLQPSSGWPESEVPACCDEDFQLHALDDGEQTDNVCHPARDYQGTYNKEMQRRLKIGKANKGKTPWNKGRKHSEETRERIKKRTIEALSDPKVRKKMSNSRPHSDQSKAKIGSAMKHIWQERFKYRRVQEHCLLSWASGIAKAAKLGSHEQQELEWDSYEKMKDDIILQQIRLKEEKARAKEIAKLRSERAAKIRAEYVARLSQQRKERKEKAKAKRSEILSPKRSKDERKRIKLSKGLKLKARLNKFHKLKKQMEASFSLQPEKMVGQAEGMDMWDVEFIQSEISRKKVSLADQLQAVKRRKSKFISTLPE